MKLAVLVLASLPLAGCAAVGTVGSFGTEILARGVVGKIDNDGGLFGRDTSTINYTPQQNAQRAANNAAVPPRNDKGTTIIQQGGGLGYQSPPAYGGGYSQAYGGGYGFSPYGPSYGPSPWRRPGWGW